MGDKGYFLEKGVIVLNRDLTDLDIFVRDFLKVLKKYSDYLIVSGFVSISSGRTRGTEDVDVLVPAMSEEKFEAFFGNLQKCGFWCYQGDGAEEVYPYIKEMHNIRFAKIAEIFPNIEFIPINESKRAQFFEFENPQKIKVRDFEFKIPPIEFEILYKEIVLASKKDMDDAKHLRTFFSEIIKEERFKKYERIIKEK